MTPDALRLNQALQRNPTLVRLGQLMQESNQRFATVRPALPVALAAHVRAGPVDEAGWSLLAANPSVAAKLRQLQPRLEERLRDAGWAQTAIRVKVQAV